MCHRCLWRHKATHASVVYAKSMQCMIVSSQTVKRTTLGQCHITLQTLGYEISNSQDTTRANPYAVLLAILSQCTSWCNKKHTTLPTNQLQQPLYDTACSNDRYRQLHAAAADVTGQSTSHGCIKAAHNSRPKEVERVFSPPPPQWGHQHRQHQQHHPAYHQAYRQAYHRACRLHHQHTSSG